MEYSVILIKPDGMKKNLVGEVISRFEKAGLKLSALKMVQLTDSLLTDWYFHHKDKPFFPSILSFMKETPVVAMIVSGEGAIEQIRKLCGVTDSTKAAKGTIRGDYGEDIQRNILHASDSPESAQKEKNLIFKEEEIFNN